LIITDTLRAYIAEPATRLRTARCIVCRGMLGSQPFTLCFLTAARACDTSGCHFDNYAVARHTGCARPLDSVLADLIIDADYQIPID
jgi:hypothetical protein